VLEIQSEHFHNRSLEGYPIFLPNCTEKIMGRPRLLEDAQNDLREQMVKRWRQQPNARKEWTSAEMETKFLGGT
jgi:hypothetical protein